MSTPLHVVRNLTKILEDFSGVARLLWERGWAEKNAGNISADVTHLMKVPKTALRSYPFAETPLPCEGMDGAFLLLTISGSRMRDVASSMAENTCIIRMSGKPAGYHVVWGNERRPPGIPTSELPAHLAIHRRLRQIRSERNVIVHTHPTELIALTQIRRYTDEARLNDLLWSMHPESIINIPRGVGLVPYILTGTQAIAEATASALERHDIVLWEKHGCLATATELYGACDLIDILAKAARIFFDCRAAGFTPTGLSHQQLAELKRAFGIKD